jgi:thioredoxin-related protein
MVAMSSELLMFEQPACEWCERWNDEIGGIYHKTIEGRRAPLNRLIIRAPLPDNIKLTSPVTYTPTFVLIEEGLEIGRITGYPGEDFFWGYLAQLIAKLSNKQQSQLESTRFVRVRG